MHFALRRTQAHFASRRTWLGLAIVGVVLGLVGPFGTFDIIAVVPRLLYWLGICAVSYAAGFASTSVLMATLGDRLRPFWPRTAIAGLLPGIPIALLVFVINGLSFGFGPGGIIDLASLLIYCPLIALCVTVASLLSIQKPAAAQGAAQPALLDRRAVRS